MVRAGALGDVLLLRPALAALRSAGHEVHLLTPGAGRLLDPDRHLDFESPNFAHVLGGGPWPAAWPVCDAALIVSADEAVRGALHRLVLQVIDCEPLPPPGVHAADHYAAALAELDIAPVPAAAVPLLQFAPRALEASFAVRERLPERFLAIHPGSGSPGKNWPAASFAELAAILSPDAAWLLVEGPADGAEVVALAAEPGAVRSGTLPLAALGALLSQAGLYVGNDSGVSHLAAAIGIPTLALFGPTEAAMWRPVGPVVRALQAPGGDLRRLSAADVAYVSGVTSMRLKSR